MPAWSRWVAVGIVLVGLAAAAVNAAASNADKGIRIVLILIVTAVITGLVPEASKALDRASSRRALLRRCAATTRAGRLPLLCERLPLLGQVDVTVLGVRTPRGAAGEVRAQLPYATRHMLDGRVRAALTGHRFVLVHGPSTAGKSRTLAEVARDLYGAWPVLVPARRDKALAELVDAGLVPENAVVWLDDLDRHLAVGVDAATVQRLLDMPNVRIVATLRAAAYEQLKPQGRGAASRPRGHQPR